MSKADMTPQDDRPRQAEALPPAGEGFPFDPATGLPPTEAVEPPPPEATPDQVRGALRALGKGVHRTAGDKRFPEHWAFTPEELDDMTGPLTAIVNRSMVLRRFLARSEYLQLGLALFGWSSRNAELSAAIAEAEGEISDTAEVPASEVEGEISDIVTPSGPFGPLYDGGF